MLALPATAAPRVVASVAPLAAIVADVMADAGSPHLLVAAGRSPHDYSLRPTDARVLAQADVVFWIGPNLETFLVKPLATLAASARVVDFDRLPGLHYLPWRQGADDHAGHRHDDEGHDPHLWLSTANAAAMARHVGEVLAHLDPIGAAGYRDNAAAAADRYLALGRAARERLAPYVDRGYVAFHDAFQYFDDEQSIRYHGAILSGSGSAPGVERLRQLRAEIVERGPACVIIEPQFPGRLARSVTEGTGTRVVVADPLGAGPDAGAGDYSLLIERLTQSFLDCLGGTR